MRDRTAWMIVVGTVAAVLLLAHPYFAVSRPSGGKVLVAEGWMHHVGLREAAELFLAGDYEHLYVTGTLRPFSYYLMHEEAIEVDFPSAASELTLTIGGLPGVHWYLIAGADTLMAERMQGRNTTHTVPLGQNAHVRFTITVQADLPPPDGAAIAYIGNLLVDDVPGHLAASRITVTHADGRMEDGQPTYAEEARADLIAHGVPDSLLTVVPTREVEHGGRTVSSARSFVAYARAHGIASFDVATLGVHARRTWKSYRQANGGRKGVGVIALHDPWCTRWTWWMNYYGVYHMTKEFVALPQTWWNDLR